MAPLPAATATPVSMPPPTDFPIFDSDFVMPGAPRVSPRASAVIPAAVEAAAPVARTIATLSIDLRFADMQL